VRTLALAVALLLPGAAVAAIPIAPRIVVGAEAVSLADLVSDAPAAWAQVALGPAPRPGGERALSGAWVLQRARQVGAEDQLEVPEDVVLFRPGDEVSRDEMVQAVERALAPRLGDGERLRVTSVSLPGPVPAGLRELSVRSPAGNLPSPATIWVDVQVAGERAARAWARVETYRSRPVVALTRDVRRDEVLEAEDVELRGGEDVADALGEPGQAVGRRAVRNLAAGTALSGRDLESVSAVGRGDAVILVARVGAVVATAPGKALEAAGVGDTLRVENAVSRQSLTGVLRDGGVVDVVR